MICATYVPPVAALRAAIQRARVCNKRRLCRLPGGGWRSVSTEDHERRFRRGSRADHPRERCTCSPVEAQVQPPLEGVTVEHDSHPPASEPFVAEHLRGVTLVDDSMVEDRLRSGDYVVFDLSKTPTSGDMVVAGVTREDGTSELLVRGYCEEQGSAGWKQPAPSRGATGGKRASRSPWRAW